MATKPSLKYDTVEIDLGDETLTLTPTLRASTVIHNRMGGMTAAFKALNDMDFNAMTAIVVAGLPKLPDSEVKDLREKLYHFGIVNLIGPLAEFLSIVNNGGKRPDDLPAAASRNDGDDDDLGNV